VKQQKGGNTHNLNERKKLPKNHILTYFRNCVADGNRMSININRLRDAVTIENHNLENGYLPEERTTLLLKKWEDNLKKEKNPDYKGSQSIAIAPVVISPFYIIPSFEHGEKHKNRNPMPVYPLWIPALLNREGKLTPPTDVRPWILRSVLEPLQRVRVSVVLSSVEKVDEFLTRMEVPRDSWKNYWDYCRLFFKEVTGKHWGDIKEQSFVSANHNSLLVDTSYNFATAALLDLYDYLRDESDLPKLFGKYISFSHPPLKKLLGDSEMESVSRRHVGHMGHQFPLNTSQRQVLYHFFTLKDGEILAVTGPPGTGKTTLIQNVVATFFVERALEGKEPPIIVAASNNNQAVTNVLETFCESQNGLGKLGGRWLPKIESYGAHLPSKKHGLTSHPPCISILGEGLPSLIETKEYFDVAKEYYLNKCKEFSGKDFTTPKSAVEWLQDQLRVDFQNILFGLESWQNYQGFDKKLIEFGGLAGLEQKILELDLELKKVITYEESVQRIRSDLLSSDKAESIWPKIFSFLSKVKKRRSAKYKMIFSDFPFSTQKINWLSLTELYECIDGAIKELNNRKQNANEKIKYYRLMRENYQKTLDSWQVWKSKFDFKNNPPLLHDELDITLRHRTFLLATHYWEGRWLLECQKLLIENNGGHALKRHKDKWQRYAMLTPCFVSTLYSLPKFFSYPIPAGNGEGYITIPNLEFIDLLIIDEAGQVSPEIGAPAFALAKKALVLGDIYQIEPVWNIPPSVDAGNLDKAGVIEDQGNPDQLLEVDKRGLSASKSSVMKAAQGASYYKLKEKKERGLYLTEHRRCDPEIISYCNELAYQGALIPMRPAPEKRLFPAFGYAHIHGVSFKRGGSRVNTQEAETISKWLKNKKEIIESHYQNSIGKTVGIITPFAAQSEAIQKALIDQGIVSESMKVGTVHALQGAEREIIIFSSVYDYRNRGSQLFFDQGVNMLNVAVSRAKDSFLIFGEMSLFDPTAKKPSGVLAHHLFKKESNEILDVYPPLRSQDSYPMRINTLNEHRNILSEVIEQAQNRVVIISPFISIYAINADKLIPKIEDAIKRKVEVLVYTDAFLDKSGLSLKESAKSGRQALEAAGARLFVINGIHNKTLCRDNNLLVEGSFNWLSASRDPSNMYQRHEVSLCYQGDKVDGLINDVLDEMDKLETISEK
jgi:hypothetical protein